MNKLQYKVGIILCLLLFNSLISFGQLNYKTTWIANSGGTPETHVQMYMVSATVNQAGISAGVTNWEEGFRGLGIYSTEGKISNPDFRDYNGGLNVGINLNFVYTAGTSGITKRSLSKTSVAMKSVNVPGISASWFEGDVAYYLKPAVADSFRLKMGITGVSANESYVVASVYQLNKVFVYDTDLNLLRTISVSRAYYAAPDKSGNVWVVQGADKDNAPKILEFNTSGVATGKEISGFSDPRSLQIDKKGRLIVGDNGTNQQVYFYDVSGEPSLVETFGQKGGITAGVPGQVKPDKFNGIVYAGTDSLDNLYVMTDREGAIIRRFDKDRNLLWQKFGLGFVDMADADPYSPNDIYTSEERYSMDYSKENGLEQEFKSAIFNYDKYNDDARGHFSVDGGVWVRRINGQKFLFLGQMYKGFMFIYRFNEATDGDIAIPCGAIMQHSRDGLGLYGEWPPKQPKFGSFIWRDKNGNGKMEEEEYETDTNTLYFDNVDDAGNIYMGADSYFECQGLDEIGSPIYSFKNIVKQDLQKPFTTVKKSIYDNKRDIMFLTGNTADLSNDNNTGPVFAVYPDWSKGNRTAAWVKGYNKTYGGFAAKGDYLFAAYAMDLGNSSVDVFSTKDGSMVGNLAPAGLGSIGWIDLPWGINVAQRPNGEYLVFREDDIFAKTVVFRWNPYEKDNEFPTRPNPLKLASKTSTSVTVSFGKATDTTGLSGYFIYANGVRSNELTVADTTYTITGLEPTTSYEIYVSAADYAGHETKSDTITVETYPVDNSAPSKPEGLTTSGTGLSSIGLIWNSATDNIGVTGYSLFLDNVKLGYKTIQDTTYLLTGLVPASQYKVKLVAYDYAGNASDTASITVSTITDDEVPTAPILYTTNQHSSSELAINWKASSDNIDVAWYNLYNHGVLLKEKIAAHEYMGIPVTGDYMLYKVTGLDANTSYEFSLKAVDLVGNESEISNTIEMKTDATWSRLLDLEEATMGIGYIFYYGMNLDISGFLMGSKMPGYMEWTVDLPADTTYRFITHFATEETFDYPMQIDINGEKVAEYTLKQLPYMTWFTYMDDPNYVIVRLKAGKNLIRLTSYAIYLPGLDLLKVTVSAPYERVASISLDSTRLEMFKNETYKLIPTFVPANATDKRIVWSSSRTGTAKVDQNGVVTAVANGTATITATTVDGSKKASCVVTVGTTGIEVKENSGDEINIYPNPAKDELFVKFSNPANEPVLLRLYNVQSNLVMSIKSTESVAGDEFRFDTSVLTKGVYILRITKGTKTDTKKVIISK